MTNKNKGSLGIFPFLSGMIAGAAAVFLSKKENRDKAKEVADEVVEKAKHLKDEVVAEHACVKNKAKEQVAKVKQAFQQSKSSQSSSQK